MTLKRIMAAMQLTPENADTTRTGFLIHGGNSSGDLSASEGFIIMDRSTRDLIGDSWNSTLQVIK